MENNLLLEFVWLVALVIYGIVIAMYWNLILTLGRYFRNYDHT